MHFWTLFSTATLWFDFYQKSFDMHVQRMLDTSRAFRGTFFNVRKVVNLIKTAKGKAYMYIMYIFGKIELSSIHAT